MQGKAVRLRDVRSDDIPIFFEHQCDPIACQMAAFTARERSDFDSHWRGVLADERIVKKTVLVSGEIAGNIVCFESGDKTLVGYWLGRSFWGEGVATRALSLFSSMVEKRPLHAYVAEQNSASIRVLEKCGFSAIEKRVGSPGDRGDSVPELIYKLESGRS